MFLDKLTESEGKQSGQMNPYQKKLYKSSGFKDTENKFFGCQTTFLKL